MSSPKKISDLKKKQLFTINGKVFSFEGGKEAKNLATEEIETLDPNRSCLTLDKRAAQVLLDRVTH